MRKRITTDSMKAGPMTGCLNRVGLGLIFLAWVGFQTSTNAYAQGRGKPMADKLAELERAVDDLRAKTVQIPTLSAAVQDLSERLAEMRRELDELARSRASASDALARLDQLDDKISGLGRDIEYLRTRLADIEQPTAEPSSRGGGVTYDGRFAWNTADDRFGVALFGYMQGRYQLDITDSDVDAASLRLRRARIGVSGHLGSRDMTYKLTLSTLQLPVLLDYYVDYKAWTDAVQVRFGQYKTPFTRNFIASSILHAFLEAPKAVELLRYDRDIQVGVHGVLWDGRVSYYAGLGNGAGKNRVNDNLDLAATLRADIVAMGERFRYGEGDLARTRKPTLMIGAGLVHDLVAMPDTVGELAVNTDVDGDGVRDNVRVISASADASFRYRGVDATLEAIFRSEDFGTILDHSDNLPLAAALGNREQHQYLDWVGHVTYVFPVEFRSHKFLAGGRFGHSRVPFLGVGGRSSSLPKGEHVTEFDGLVQLYSPRGYRLAGLMYSMHDYSARPGEDTGGMVEHRVILETQLIF